MSKNNTYTIPTISERDDLISQISDASKDLNGWRYRPAADTSIEDLREMAEHYWSKLQEELERPAREAAEQAEVEAKVLGGFLGPAPKSPFAGL